MKLRCSFLGALLVCPDQRVREEAAEAELRPGTVWVAANVWKEALWRDSCGL